ncbi:MAG: FkbM family methyltransferase [Bacteroidia bacterium]|nr:FkbM family methyltransferase [Bacteroidia bacterium]
MRIVINFFLKLYLLPLTFSHKVKGYVRDMFFVDEGQHLRQVVKIITKEKLKNEGIIIDIGAANGGVSAFFAKNFPGNSVYGFEPNPSFGAMLSIAGNYPENVQFRNVALSNKEGEMPFYITRNLLSSSLKKINKQALHTDKDNNSALLEVEKEVLVKVSTLDNEFVDLKGSVLLMKIDVQGAELDVLKGGVKLLEKTKYIITEMQMHKFYDNASPYYSVDEFLRENGFKLIDIIANVRRQGIWLEEFDAIYRNSNFNSV